MADKTDTPRRRPTEEIRGLILRAAREKFLADGYEATTTKEIADRAGVNERLLFTNFGSKPGLFDAALVGPISEVITQYLEVKHADDVPVEERLHVFIEGLYNIACDNRTVLRSVLGSTTGAGQDGPGSELFDHIGRTLHRSLERNGVSDYPEVDSTAAMIDLAGMVFGVALLDDMLIPRGTRRPSRARLLAEMNKMAAYRLLYSAASPVAVSRHTLKNGEDR
jgi:AcrR family transcriptional regulator